MLSCRVNRILCSITKMGYQTGMQLDWNPIVHILDTLSDGTHSFLELSYMVPHYDGGVITESLLFLADRELVQLSTSRGPFTPIPKSEWPQRLRDAFGTDGAEQSSMTDTAIDLTENGEHVLRLLGVGHP